MYKRQAQKDEKDPGGLEHNADQDVDLSLVSAIGELNTEAVSYTHLLSKHSFQNILHL